MTKRQEIIELLSNREMTSYEVSSRVGCSREYVRAIARNYDLNLAPDRHTGRIPKELEDAIILRYNEGWNAEAIQAEFCIAGPTLYNTLDRRGIPRKNLIITGNQRQRINEYVESNRKLSSQTVIDRLLAIINGGPVDV